MSFFKILIFGGFAQRSRVSPGNPECDEYRRLRTDSNETAAAAAAAAVAAMAAAPAAGVAVRAVVNPRLVLGVFSLSEPEVSSGPTVH